MGKRKNDGRYEYRKLYYAWINMLERCKNKNLPMYPHYGGRGISVCDEWKEFAAFKEWALGNGYMQGLSLDRIDNNGNYEPSNCRWATMQTQMNNTSRNTVITYNGETHTLVEWSRIAGVNYSTFCNRWVRGWSVERMIEQPTQKRRKGESD